MVVVDVDHHILETEFVATPLDRLTDMVIEPRGCGAAHCDSVKYKEVIHEAESLEEFAWLIYGYVVEGAFDICDRLVTAATFFDHIVPSFLERPHRHGMVFFCDPRIYTRCFLICDDSWIGFMFLWDAEDWGVDTFPSVGIIDVFRTRDEPAFDVFLEEFSDAFSHLILHWFGRMDIIDARHVAIDGNLREALERLFDKVAIRVICKDLFACFWV